MNCPHGTPAHIHCLNCEADRLEREAEAQAQRALHEITARKKAADYAAALEAGKAAYRAAIQQAAEEAAAAETETEEEN